MDQCGWKVCKGGIKILRVRFNNELYGREKNTFLVIKVFNFGGEGIDH